MHDNNTHNNLNIADRIKVHEDLILELNFVPAWARKPPSQAHYYADTPDEPKRSPKSPRGHTRDTRLPRRSNEHTGAKSRLPRRTNEHTGAKANPPPRLNIRFLPEKRPLSAVVRKINATGHAYPVVELASLFLANPNTCYVRIELPPDSTDVHLLQCARCGTLALDKTAFLAHLTDSHLADYFDKEEQILDPPSGDFVCIARCGLSGELLGPPNHHSCAARAREIHRTRYPDMSFADYQNRIEKVNDKNLIEEWKAASRKHTVYRSTESPEAKPMTWQQANTHLIRHIAPTLTKHTRKAALAAATAKELKDPTLRNAVSAAWHRENRFPADLSNALRGAFRHKQLYLFKAPHGHTFVTATRPVPLNKSHVIDSIRDVLAYLEQHPGSSRDHLRTALSPNSAPDSPEAQSILSPLSWLCERGHIIEFFDGSLAVPLGPKGSGAQGVIPRPKWGPRGHSSK